jgi:hypothetical protein
VSKKQGLVYFIASVQEKEVRVKIGFTRGDPMARLRNLQCGSPFPLGIYTAFSGDEATEKLFHRTFAPLRLHGEWFEMKGKLRDFLICLFDDAMERKPADWDHVFEAIQVVILATEPIRDDDDPEEYMGSANMEPWEWMHAALAEADAEGATIQ